MEQKFLKTLQNEEISIVTLDFYCSQNNRNKINIFEKIPSQFDGEPCPVP